MQPVQLIVVGATTSPPIIFDTKQNPFNIGIGVSIQTGAATWAIEHCFDFTTVMSPTWNGTSTVTWFQNSGLGASPTGTSVTTSNGNYAFAVAAIRLNVYSTSNSTTTVVANLIQSVNSP
jgi:hypothetical protein